MTILHSVIEMWQNRKSKQRASHKHFIQLSIRKFKHSFKFWAAKYI